MIIRICFKFPLGIIDSQSRVDRVMRQLDREISGNKRVLAIDEMKFESTFPSQGSFSSVLARRRLNAISSEGREEMSVTRPILWIGWKKKKKKERIESTREIRDREFYSEGSDGINKKTFVQQTHFTLVLFLRYISFHNYSSVKGA